VRPALKEMPMQRPWLRSSVLILAAAALVGRPDLAAQKESSSLGRKALAYATSKLGEKVGDGEC
jgi:hypothetical protein